MNLDAIILATVVTACASLSATLGMAGGSILLASLTAVFVPKQALIYHMASQLVGSIYRVYLLRAHIRYTAAIYFVLGLITSLYLGYILFKNFEFKSLKIIIGAFLLMSVFVKSTSEYKWPSYTLLPAGLLIGVIGSVVGAVGSLISVVLMRVGFFGEVFIATKSLIQLSTHTSRLLVYMQSGSLSTYINMQTVIIIMSSSLIGTFIGKRYFLIKDKKKFTFYAKLFIFIAGLVMIVKGLYS